MEIFAYIIFSKLCNFTFHTCLKSSWNLFWSTEWGRDPVVFRVCFFFNMGQFSQDHLLKSLSFLPFSLQCHHCYIWIPYMHVGSFLKFILLLWKQPHQPPLLLACEAVPTGNEGLRSSSCSVNHPIFQEGAKVSSPPDPHYSSPSSWLISFPRFPWTFPIPISSFFFLQGTFIVTFDVSYKATLGDKLLLRANASRWA